MVLVYYYTAVFLPSSSDEHRFLTEKLFFLLQKNVDENISCDKGHLQQLEYFIAKMFE